MIKQIIIVLFCASLFACDCKDESIPILGYVVDYKSEPIPEAHVSVIVTLEDGVRTEIIKGMTDKAGQFEIIVSRSKKYVVNIRKNGYGFVSSLYEHSIEFSVVPINTYYLQKANVVEIDPTVGGTITVSNTQSIGSSASRADWSQSPSGNLPLVIDDHGRVTSFIMPENLRNAWNLHASKQVSLPAASITIPPNALSNSGIKPQDKVSVSFTAIDMFAPNGMPGNNVAYTRENEIGTMQSYGAVIVEVYDSKQSYNLTKGEGTKAELLIPVPRWQLNLKPDLPKSVPILFYNKETGLWKEESSAEYIDSLQAYRGFLSHFSAINFDIVKTEPSACTSFYYDTAPNFTPPFVAEVTTEDAANNQLYVRSRTVDNLCPSTPNGFSLNRLPANSNTAVAFYDDIASPVAKALYVLKTRNPGYQEITDNPTNRPTCSEIDSDTFCTKIQIDQVDFTNLETGTTSPILLAICEEDDAYKISFATNDASLDFRNYLLKVSNNIPGSADCGSGGSQNEVLLDPSDPLNPPAASFNIIIDHESPGIDSEFNVSVFEILITEFCQQPQNNEFRVEIIDKATSGIISALKVVPGSCSI